eukprot:c22407_g1_i2 orf=377-898(-)
MCPPSRSDMLHNLWTRLKPQSDQSQLKEAFSLLDKDGDGAISHSDLYAFFESCNKSVINDQEIKDMIAYADTDGNGRVDYQEFENLLGAETDEMGSTLASSYLEDPSLQEVFRIMDQDGDGVLSMDDLRQFWRESGYPISQEDLEMMLEAASTTAPSHSVSFEGFVQYFMIAS